MESLNVEYFPSKAGKWLGLASAIVTVSLTVLNAYWSKQIETVDQQLKQREADLKALQLELDAGKEKLARYTFVHKLFDGVLNQDQAQKTLTVNLMTLALTEEEAQQLFAGLQASDNADARDVGSLGSDVVALQGLVAQMNDVVRQNRVGAVEKLIQTHRTNSAAVDQAIKLIEPPKLENLSASGRINVLVFLSNTEAAAWSPDLIRRATSAIHDIRDRSDRGVAVIGSQTEGSLKRLEAHLAKLD